MLPFTEAEEYKNQYKNQKRTQEYKYELRFGEKSTITTGSTQRAEGILFTMDSDKSKA